MSSEKYLKVECIVPTEKLDKIHDEIRNILKINGGEEIGHKRGEVRR